MRTRRGSGAAIEAQFLEWQKQALELATALRGKLPDLAEALGTGQTRGEIEGSLDVAIKRIGGLSYAQVGRVLLLPQYVRQLSATPGGITYHYDPSRPPPAELRAALSERGLTTREIEGGGWDAVNPDTGQVVFQAIPLTEAAGAVLPPSLEQLAAGPRAATGLARIRAQTAVPRLESQ